MLSARRPSVAACYVRVFDLSLTVQIYIAQYPLFFHDLGSRKPTALAVGYLDQGIAKKTPCRVRGVVVVCTLLLGCRGDLFPFAQDRVRGFFIQVPVCHIGVEYVHHFYKRVAPAFREKQVLRRKK